MSPLLLAAMLLVSAAPASTQPPAPDRQQAPPAKTDQAVKAATIVPVETPPVLTLDDAIRLALGRSEQLAAAQFGATRARAEERRARADLLPQIFASASYDRTVASEFSGLFSGDSSTPSCDPFTLRPAAALVDRVAEIERAIDCGAVGNPFGSGSFDNLPFGRKNIYRFGLSVTQNLYTGGRVTAQRALAAIGRETADISVASTRAQAVFEITQAFYDAALSDRLVTIAEATLAQAEATLARVTLGREAGRQPEFDRLRAQVDRDNQRPAVIRARSQRTLAYLRLRQILEVSASEPLAVVANLDEEDLPPPRWFANQLGQAARSIDEAAVEARTAVRQSVSSVRARQEAVKIVRAQRLPSVSASSLLSRVGYPDNLVPNTDFRTNWTVGVSVQVPLFTGGRIAAEQAAARADLAATEAQLKLVREFAWLDAQAAVEAVATSRAAWEASAGTVQQATRAYEIAELRYREGISTQLELSDARLLLQQAQANRAVAARDLQVARARLALLPDLPLSSAGGVTASDAAASGSSVGVAGSR